MSNAVSTWLDLMVRTRLLPLRSGDACSISLTCFLFYFEILSERRSERGSLLRKRDGQRWNGLTGVSMRSIQQTNHLARKERRRIDLEYRERLNYRRAVENSKCEVDAKAEQLKAIAEIATVLAGYLTRPPYDAYIPFFSLSVTSDLNHPIYYPTNNYRVYHCQYCKCWFWWF